MIKSPKNIGIVSEQKVIAALVSLGYIVSVPIGDNCSYDLLIDHKGCILKCQVKTMRETIYGSVAIPLTRSRINTKKCIKKPYSKKEIDIFLGYYRENDAVYFFPFKNTKLANSVTFRTRESKNCQKTKTRNLVNYELKNMSAYLETGKV